MKTFRICTLFSVIALLTSFAACGDGGGGGGGSGNGNGGGGAVCGNHICETGESATTCPQDCGSSGSCTAGQTQACENCGTQTCSGSGTWGVCNSQGVCSPGQTQSCSDSGTQTCTNSCAWGNCSGQLSASPVSAGGNLTCALTSSHGVKCWGKGPLGDGTYNSSYVPKEVSGLSSGISAISVGGDEPSHHACAVTNGGGAKCWGDNHFGELGDGTHTTRLTPANVSGLSSGVSAISVGHSHTCALTTSGGAKCWGNNWAGMLGSGGPASGSNIPVDVVGLSVGVKSISASGEQSCAVTSSGGAMCWGSNFYKELGDGTTAFCRFTPVSVSGLSSGVSAISVTYRYTCALTSMGGVKCWGEGPLGNGASNSSNIPVNVTGLSSGISAISVGGYATSHHACALTTGGGVKCWGNNTYGQLGDGTTAERYIPVNVSGLTSGVIAISAGRYHTCALTSSGSIKCWGANDSGQLGNGTTSGSSIPINALWP